jgi:phage terminase small subunit
VVPQVPKKKPLTAQQQRFVDEYILDPNATQAYRRAFGTKSYWSAATEGRKLLKNPQIKREIAAARTAQQRRTRVTADRVLREVARLAFSDIDHVMDLTDPANPRLKPRSDIPHEARVAIQEVARTKHGVRVKLADKNVALDKLMRRLGMYQELTPMELILGLLPRDVADEMRRRIAQAVPGEPAANPDAPDD